MKLWLLKPIGEETGPWSPWYDKAFGFVVRAETEEDARRFAQDQGGDEVRRNGSAWTDPKLSTCVPLTPKGEAGVVLRDFHAA